MFPSKNIISFRGDARRNSFFSSAKLRWVYICVVATEACPRSSLTEFIPAPWLSRVVAKVCLNT